MRYKITPYVITPEERRVLFYNKTRSGSSSFEAMKQIKEEKAMLKQSKKINSKKKLPKLDFKLKFEELIQCKN